MYIVYSMTPQYWSYTWKSVFNDSSSIGQIPRKVYSMTPEVLLRYLEMYIVYSMTPQLLVIYLEKCIQ